MSKGHLKSEIKTSESKDFQDYWVQNGSNTALAEQWLQMLYPDLASFRNLLVDTDTTFDDLLDYIYNLKVVKNHGYGSISTTVYEGKITKIEGLIRTVKTAQTEIKRLVNKAEIEKLQSEMI